MRQLTVGLLAFAILAMSAPSSVEAADPLGAAMQRSIAGSAEGGWAHSGYVATVEGASWYGGSVDFRPSGLPVGGFDDQHEVALTVYTDARNGETDGRYPLFPTFAVALVRSRRERLSVNLRSDPDNIDVFTLSTSAPADSDKGRYVYAKSSDGSTITVEPDSTHNLSLRSSGRKVLVYNRDALSGGRAVYENGEPAYADWPDISDADGAAGHWAYRWDAYLDGERIDSAWLDSPTGRVKLESNKRIAALSADRSTTYATAVRLAKSASPYATRTWDSSIDTTRLVTSGEYRWDVTKRYTKLHAVLPADPPRATFVRCSNPIAYELKSLQTARWSTLVDKPDVRAELSVKCPTGTKYLYRGDIEAAGETFTFPPWNGTGPDGKRLPSAIYDWTLKLTKNGSTSTYTGKIIVSRIYFALSGTAKNGAPVTSSAYMLAGSANCYVSAWTSAASDSLGLGLTGPGGLAVPTRRFALACGSPLSATTYFRAESAPRAAGMHAWTMTAASAVTYRITVMQ